MPNKIHAAKGKLGDVYHQMLIEAGPEGISISELQRLAGVQQAFNITKAIARHLQDGRIIRVRPVKNRASWLYAGEYPPPPIEAKKRGPRQPRRVDECLALLVTAGEDGIEHRKLVEHFQESEQTTSLRLAWMERAGQVVGLCGLVRGSRSHRIKTWFIKGLEPSTLPKAKRPEVKAFKLDPQAPAIIPKGLKPIVCPGPTLDRYKADPSIAGRGVISQDWFERRQYGI